VFIRERSRRLVFESINVQAWWGDDGCNELQEHDLIFNPELPGLVISHPPYGERMGDEWH